MGTTSAGLLKVIVDPEMESPAPDPRATSDPKLEPTRDSPSESPTSLKARGPLFSFSADFLRGRSTATFAEWTTISPMKVPNCGDGPNSKVLESAVDCGRHNTSAAEARSTMSTV